ncbi:uncharacterized protein VDAG_07032 [Verticillium dahliae VdLs.17]|uniref:Mitochondrial ATP synthase epsilon chain domain-containing protein n=3 Tax=Verticillium TaxID=1036719 RepID=G2XAC9_VERDV|nr:uncharacterized protein VDAG_07032 [Verticillium dahliae VdLs.17]EGY15868.1 hypothetical protein VDAG_07032 [Verticillium dahliae VdLs.17]
MVYWLHQRQLPQRRCECECAVQDVAEFVTARVNPSMLSMLRVSSRQVSAHYIALPRGPLGWDAPCVVRGLLSKAETPEVSFRRKSRPRTFNWHHHHRTRNHPPQSLPSPILAPSPIANMVFAWKAAGITYNRFLAVSARAVRRSLKEDKRIIAERRGAVAEIRFAKWENGKMGEPKDLVKANAAQAVENAAAGSS